MIFILCAFLYHDGRLLHDERLRHERFLDERLCSVIISRCPFSLFHFCFYTLHLGVSGLVFLHVSTRFSGLVFTALIFSLQLSLFVLLIYTQVTCSCFFLSIVVFMVYGECGLRTKCFACGMTSCVFFSCLLTDRIYMHEGFCFQGVQEHVATASVKKIQLMGSRSMFLQRFFLFVYLCLSDNCLPLYMCISPHRDVSRM